MNDEHSVLPTIDWSARVMSKSVTQTFTWLMWLVCFVVVISVACETHAAEPTDNVASALIHLTNGDYATGRFADSPGSGRLAWQSAAFLAPFEFPTQTVNTIQFPVPAKLAQPEGTYCFELGGATCCLGRSSHCRVTQRRLRSRELGGCMWRSRSCDGCIAGRVAPNSCSLGQVA